MTLAMIEAEIETLALLWNIAGADPGHAALAGVLPDPDALALVDRAQLAVVIRTCRESKTLSAAGRQLFAVSWQEKSSLNNADRLRRYLARFGLDWARVTGG